MNLNFVIKTPSRRVFEVFNYILLGLFGIICLLPVLHCIWASFSDPTLMAQHSGMILYPLFDADHPITWYGYKMVFGNNSLLMGYANTIFYCALGGAFSTIVCTMGGFVLSRKGLVIKNYIMVLITITMFFNGGMIPTYLVVKSYGLLDTIWGVILPGAVSTWNFIVMRSFFDNYPSEIEESGKVDGLTDAGVFFRLVLPTSKAVLATIGLYYAVSLWNAYFIPFIYLNDPDLFSLQLILHELLSAGSSNNATVGVGDVLVVEESLKYATVLVSIAPIMCVYPFLQKYFVKGVMIGAVKG